MATEEIGARLSLKDRLKFSRESRKAKEDVDAIGDAAEKTDHKAKGLGRTLGGLGGGIKTLGGLAFKAGAILGGVAAAGIGAFAAMGVQAYAAAEQAEISFTTMLGSGEKAKAFLADLENFAATTPFEMQGLTNAAQGLLAFGFQAKEVLPMMTAIGDASAALGAGEEGMDRMVRAMGQIQAKGKASAEDLMQLAELGVPVWDMLAKKLGTDVPTAMEKVSKGEVKAAETIDALLTGMNDRFGGLMEKQATSVGGLWSTLQDNIRITAKRAVEPFGDDIKMVMTGAISQVEKFGAWFTDEFPGHIENARKQAPNLWAAFKDGDMHGVAEVVDNMFGNTGKLVDPLKEVLYAAEDVWVVLSDLFMPVIQDIIDMLPSFATPLGLARDTLGWMADNAEALRPVLFGLLAAFLAYRTLHSIVAIWKTMTAASLVHEGVTKRQAIAQWLLNKAFLGNPIVLIVALIIGLVAAFIYLWKNNEGFRKFWIKMWEGIKSAVGTAKDWIVEKFTALVGWFKSVPGKISSAASGMWDGIKDAFKGVINWVIDAWNSIDFEINIAIPDWIPKIGGKGWQSGDIVPDIPRLHSGGRTTSGGAAIIQPDEEMVVLPPAASVIPTPEGRVASEVFNGGGGERVIRIPVYLDRRQIAEAVYDSTRDEVARR